MEEPRSQESLKVTDIRCLKCGAPASFDIRSQRYHCAYCGQHVGIEEALAQVKGFRAIQQTRIQENARQLRLGVSSCSGCGAQVIFEENEALAECPYCGRNLVRKNYLDLKDFPENVIPFALTLEDARHALESWCKKHAYMSEAKHIRPLIHTLKGAYLPYELVKGPVHLVMGRMDRGKAWKCEGLINSAFISRSRQNDNLLLDGMEPFDQDGVTEFQFGWLAGHHVKIPDLSEHELSKRVKEECESSYLPYARSLFHTKAAEVSANERSLVRIPVLLPVYTIVNGNVMAAVNGQTGKVSVRAEKDSHYYFLPWWLKAVLSTFVISFALFVILFFSMNERSGALIITGMFALVMLVITLSYFSDTARNPFSVSAGRRIFTSAETTGMGKTGAVAGNESAKKDPVEKPVFFMELDGKPVPVELKFLTAGRVVRMILMALTALFLPVIIALFLNGFDFSRLELGGSAVWFCIMVPVVPVYFLKFGIVELYDRPLVWQILEDGRKKRVLGKSDIRFSKETLKTILRALFIPPASLAVWFCIICFCLMCWLTAFGFGD